MIPTQRIPRRCNVPRTSRPALVVLIILVAATCVAPAASATCGLTSSQNCGEYGYTQHDYPVNDPKGVPAITVDGAPSPGGLYYLNITENGTPVPGFPVGVFTNGLVTTHFRETVDVEKAVNLTVFTRHYYLADSTETSPTCLVVEGGQCRVGVAVDPNHPDNANAHYCYDVGVANHGETLILVPICVPYAGQFVYEGVLPDPAPPA